jgi:hypothetical protein
VLVLDEEGNYKEGTYSWREGAEGGLDQMLGGDLNAREDSRMD